MKACFNMDCIGKILASSEFTAEDAGREALCIAEIMMNAKSLIRGRKADVEKEISKLCSRQRKIIELEQNLILRLSRSQKALKSLRPPQIVETKSLDRDGKNTVETEFVDPDAEKRNALNSEKTKIERKIAECDIVLKKIGSALDKANIYKATASEIIDLTDVAAAELSALRETLKQNVQKIRLSLSTALCELENFAKLYPKFDGYPMKRYNKNPKGSLDTDEIKKYASKLRSLSEKVSDEVNAFRLIHNKTYSDWQDVNFEKVSAILSSMSAHVYKLCLEVNQNCEVAIDAGRHIEAYLNQRKNLC